MLAHILPELEWFGEHFNLDNPYERMVGDILGKVLIEINEFKSYKISLEQIKAFFSQCFYSARLAYARRNIRIPRRVTFVGTSNNKRPLPNDESGNRRFIPVYCQRKFFDYPEHIPELFNVEINENGDIRRDCFFAWALREVSNGNDGQIPGELREVHEIAAEGARSGSQLIRDQVANLPRDREMSLKEIAEEINFELSPRTEKQLTSELRAAGWDSRRARKADGGRGQVWFCTD